MTTTIKKFSPQFSCPKCGSDKCQTRLDTPDPSTESALRRKRLGWPPGELMIQTCQICSHVQISRPLDYQQEDSGT